MFEADKNELFEVCSIAQTSHGFLLCIVFGESLFDEGGVELDYGTLVDT